MAYAVLTRDAAEVAPYAAALAALGLEVIATPVTMTVGPEVPGALAAALAAGAVECIMVTSARGAAALLAEALPAVRAALPPVYVVGDATRAALAAAGVAAIHPDGVRDGEGLARALIAGSAPRRALYPRAAEGRDAPIAILRAAGWRVDDVVAYRTVARAADDPAAAEGLARLAAGDAAVCAVFAPSQVAALARCGPLASLRTRWIAIGETTAAALRAAGVAEVAVAEAPTPVGIANAARAVYRLES